MSQLLCSSLSLEQLKVPVFLGVSQAERKTKQTIEINLTIWFTELPKACHTDQLEDTICYAQLIDMIKNFCLKKPFCLIEYLGYELYKFLKKTITCSHINLEIRKKPMIHGLWRSIFSLKDQEMCQ